MNESTFAGMRISENAALTQAGRPYEVRRSWRERLLSWPWRPLVATRTEVPQVPYDGAVHVGRNHLMMHPATVARLREMARQQEQPCTSRC